jgi:hypothetical protein
VEVIGDMESSQGNRWKNLSGSESVREGDVDVDEVEVSGGQMLGGKRSDISEWNEWR